MDPIDAHQLPQAVLGPTGQAIVINSFAVLVRLIPALIALGCIWKLQRFPTLKPLHMALLVDAVLVLGIDLITITPAHDFMPSAIYDTAIWPLVTVLTAASLVVFWVWSLIKTRLQPQGITRILDIATIFAIAALLIALGFLLLLYRSNF